MTILDLLSKIPPLSQLVDRSSILGPAALSLYQILNPRLLLRLSDLSLYQVLNPRLLLRLSDSLNLQVLSIYLSSNRFSPLREQSTTDPGPTLTPPCTLVVLHL